MCVEKSIVKWYCGKKKERAFGGGSLLLGLWGDGVTW